MKKQKSTGPEISRRNFVKSVGVAAAALSLPNVLRGEDKKMLVLGSDSHKYEWIGNWCQMPNGHKFGNTHGVQVDSQGRVLIHSQNADPDTVYIFDAEGKYIKSWGKEYKAGAHGFQLIKEGDKEFLYLSETAQHFVVKTTLDGEVVWKLEFPKECAAYANLPANFKPTNTAVLPNGDFYVADGYGLSLVHHYQQKDGKPVYVRTFGGKGKEAGQLSCPHGIWYDTRGKEPALLVADRANVRLQYFSLEGKHLSFVTDELRAPCHFDVFNGELLIPDLHGRVTIFDKNNKLITHLGDNQDPAKRGKNKVPPSDWSAGQFVAPHGACYDKDGNIFVAEWLVPGRVTKLKALK